MNILVTGANGFLGQHLIKYLSQKHNVTGVSRGDCRIQQQDGFTYLPLELTDADAVSALVTKLAPQVIIHTAANSKPDDCENNQPGCIANNVQATANLIEPFKLLNNTAGLFIYLSTDFVFGENGPHSEVEAFNPLNFYGQSKLMAEQLVTASGVPYAIVRPVFIYGPVWPGLRPSFLHWVKNSLEQKKQIKVVSDQLRTPTYVYDICKGIESIIEGQKTGAYHLAGKDVLSPYDMAVATARVLGLDESLIINVTSETFPEPVKRAKRSGLKIDKAVQELGYAPVSFDEGISYTFA